MEPRPDLFAGGAGPADRLAAWVAALRVEEAASARSREGFLRRTAVEDATFAGVLLDLAERGAPVLVVTTAGRRHRGVVGAVGSDFVALVTPEGRAVLLAHTGMASVQPEAGAAATGDRAVEVTVGIAEAVATLAEDRPRVLVVPAGGDAVGMAGELEAAGRDVLVVRLDGAERRTAYVALASLTELSTG